MAATFNKEQSRWERSAAQECRTCGGCGECEEVVGHHYDLHVPETREVPCPDCDGTGFRFQPARDSLHVLSDARYGVMYHRTTHRSDVYQRLRAKYTQRRTLGWMCFSLAERAISTGVASDAAVAAWRDAA